MPPRSMTPGLVAIGLGIPLASLVLLALWAPLSSHAFLGIRGSIWSLFACVPLTSLCLLTCNALLGDGGQGEDGR